MTWMKVELVFMHSRAVIIRSLPFGALHSSTGGRACSSVILRSSSSCVIPTVYFSPRNQRIFYRLLLSTYSIENGLRYVYMAGGTKKEDSQNDYH